VVTFSLREFGFAPRQLRRSALSRCGMLSQMFQEQSAYPDVIVLTVVRIPTLNGG